jgi:hypothetical protein
MLLSNSLSPYKPLEVGDSSLTKESTKCYNSSKSGWLNEDIPMFHILQVQLKPIFF